MFFDAWIWILICLSACKGLRCLLPLVVAGWNGNVILVSICWFLRSLRVTAIHCFGMHINEWCLSFIRLNNTKIPTQRGQLIDYASSNTDNCDKGNHETLKSHDFTMKRKKRQLNNQQQPKQTVCTIQCDCSRNYSGHYKHKTPVRRQDKKMCFFRPHQR